MFEFFIPISFFGETTNKKNNQAACNHVSQITGEHVETFLFQAFATCCIQKREEKKNKHQIQQYVICYCTKQNLANRMM